MRDRIIDGAYRRLARHDAVVRLALRLRDVSAALAAHRISEGADAERNGECWFADLAGRSASVFVDVGANVGDWTARVLRVAPANARALLFEPGPTAVAQLRRRFADRRTIEVLPVALGAAAGELTFYAQPDAGVMSSLVAEATAGPTEAHTVEVRTLDDELERTGCTAVDLLKVDAEGYDLHVLRGATRALADHRIALVQFEYHHAWALAGSTIGDAQRWLENLGYRVFVLRSDGLYDLDYERFGEFRTPTNFVACAPQALDLVADRLRGPLLSR